MKKKELNRRRSERKRKRDEPSTLSEPAASTTPTSRETDASKLEAADRCVSLPLFSADKTVEEGHERSGVQVVSAEPTVPVTGKADDPELLEEEEVVVDPGGDMETNDAEAASTDGAADGAALTAESEFDRGTTEWEAASEPAASTTPTSRETDASKLEAPDRCVSLPLFSADKSVEEGHERSGVQVVSTEPTSPVSGKADDPELLEEEVAGDPGGDMETNGAGTASADAAAFTGESESDRGTTESKAATVSGASAEADGAPSSGGEDFDEGIIEHVQLLVSLIDHEELSREETIELLRRVMRQHSIANESALDYVVGQLKQKPP